MPNWNISKQIDFCYGHRVHSQELIKGYSIDDKLCCRHFHGHQGKILVHLDGDTLKNGMVSDFKHLGWFKKWVDDVLDHKFIMDINDPIINHELPIIDEIGSIDEVLTRNEKYNYYTIRPTLYTTKPEYVKEKYEGMIIVDFVPTSENLSKWLCDIVTLEMEKINVNVLGIEFFETPKSRSMYRR